MPSFGRITARQQELEGRFRSRHADTLNNAEEIAFLHGAAKEQKLIDASFGQILANKQEMVTKRVRLGLGLILAHESCANRVKRVPRRGRLSIGIRLTVHALCNGLPGFGLDFKRTLDRCAW